MTTGYSNTYTQSTQLTFKSALMQLKKRETKKLCNNTYLVHLNDTTIAVRLHATNIIVLHPDEVEIFSGGYRTYTTKDRINAYSPVGISQRNGLWYVGYSLFYEGMRVSYDGSLISPVKNGAKDEKQAAAMKKRISTYADTCIAAIKKGIALPGAGDCWYCSLITVDDQTPLGDKTTNTQHLLSHMKEKYVVPSLIRNAMKESGYSDQQFYLFLGYDKSGVSGKHMPSFAPDYNIKRCIYKYMVKRLVTAALP